MEEKASRELAKSGLLELESDHLKKLNEQLRKENTELQKQNVILENEKTDLQKQKVDLEKDKTELQTEVEHLKEEIKHLQKPKWAKPNKYPDKSLIKKDRKKLGPKFGHKASVRKVVEDQPDHEVVWVPELCIEGHGLLPFPSKWHEHTQIDIPVHHNVVVTKHVVGWSWCSGCRKYHPAKHKKLSYSKYGPNLHAYAAYLKFDLGLTLQKIQRLLFEQYKLNISTGVISEMVSRTARCFKPEYEKMKLNLKNEPYLHADETGWRNGGNNEWLWSFSNEKVSVFVIEPSRAQKVVKDVLGTTYDGVLVSDFYGAYNRIFCRKQRCWTHLLRELHVLEQKHPKDKEVIYFKTRLKRFYERACALKEQYLSDKNVNQAIKRLDTDTLTFLMKTFSNEKLNTLIKRMIKYYYELYTFIKADVEPTNNPAEREIRPAVLMRKTSYCNRSEQGKRNQAILMSIIATAKKTNKSFISYASDKLKTIELS